MHPIAWAEKWWQRAWVVNYHHVCSVHASTVHGLPGFCSTLFLQSICGTRWGKLPESNSEQTFDAETASQVGGHVDPAFSIGTRWVVTRSAEVLRGCTAPVQDLPQQAQKHLLFPWVALNVDFRGLGSRKVSSFSGQPRPHFGDSEQPCPCGRLRPFP